MEHPLVERMRDSSIVTVLAFIVFIVFGAWVVLSLDGTSCTEYGGHGQVENTYDDGCIP